MKTSRQVVSTKLMFEIDHELDVRECVRAFKMITLHTRVPDIAILAALHDHVVDNVPIDHLHDGKETLQRKIQAMAELGGKPGDRSC